MANSSSYAQSSANNMRRLNNSDQCVSHVARRQLARHFRDDTADTATCRPAVVRSTSASTSTRAADSPLVHLASEGFQDLPFEDFFFAFDQVNQRFASGPGVLTASHGRRFERSLILVADRLLEQVGMTLGQADPLRLALEETEVAAGSVSAIRNTPVNRRQHLPRFASLRQSRCSLP